MPIVDIIIARSREASLAARSRETTPHSSPATRISTLPIPPVECWSNLHQAPVTDASSVGSSYGELKHIRYKDAAFDESSDLATQTRRSMCYSVVTENRGIFNRGVRPEDNALNRELFEYVVSLNFASQRLTCSAHFLIIQANSRLVAIQM